MLVHTDPTLVDLTIDGEQVETTPEHPFYTQEYGWVGAGYLWQGAHIRKADGSFGVVQAVKVVQRQQVMYNLTVEGAHTFFVGDKHWLVHNNNCNFDELGQDTLLSNGQTNREFRQSKDNCFYCGRSLNHLEERPDRRTLGVAKAEELAKAQSITEHIYSKDLARQFGNHLTQDEADQYVRSVDGLVVACRSCNSSKGKKNLLDWKGPKSGWVTGSRETAVSVYNYIKDKYGFTGP